MSRDFIMIGALVSLSIVEKDFNSNAAFRRKVYEVLFLFWFVADAFETWSFKPQVIAVASVPEGIINSSC